MKTLRQEVVEILNKFDVEYSKKSNTKRLISLLKNSDRVNWGYVSEDQKLSEDFIREFQDKVDWGYISKYQKLSEDFIREFKDKVDWYWVSQCQKLSENFIREFEDIVYWDWVSEGQKLSEDFIREFKDRVYWGYISKYQKLSEDFIREFDLGIPDNNWLYTTREKKLEYIKNNTKYEVVDDNYIIAYKSVRIDNYSVYNFQYQYLVGNTYESHCDCNLKKAASFGLSAWTKEKALDYHNKGKLLKVKIDIEDIGVIVHNCQKIRCFKLEVLEEVDF